MSNQFSMRGFSAWYNKAVKKEYRGLSYRQLCEIYGGEKRNTGSIEIPAYMTKSGRTETF